MENFIIRALAILASSDGHKNVLKLSHFPSFSEIGIQAEKNDLQEQISNGNDAIPINKNYEVLLNEYSKRMILWALGKAEGNKTAASELLGIKRTTLTYKIKELNLE